MIREIRDLIDWELPDSWKLPLISDLLRGEQIIDSFQFESWLFLFYHL